MGADPLPRRWGSESGGCCSAASTWPRIFHDVRPAVPEHGAIKRMLVGTNGRRNRRRLFPRLLRVSLATVCRIIRITRQGAELLGRLRSDDEFRISRKALPIRVTPSARVGCRRLLGRWAAEVLVLFGSLACRSNRKWVSTACDANTFWMVVT
jgi:hypothetical protein